MEDTVWELGHTPRVPRTAAIGAYLYQIPSGLGPDLYVERCQWPSSRGKSGQKGREHKGTSEKDEKVVRAQVSCQ